MTEPNLRQYRLANSRSYRLCRQISTYLDDYYLDGILGLVPVLGGFLSSAFSLVFMYVACFKIRSWRLSVVILFNIVKDTVIGLIPFLGTILDFFYKANKRNFALLDGFVAGDEAVVREVNRQSQQAVLGLFVLTIVAVGLIYLTVWLSVQLWQVLSSMI